MFFGRDLASATTSEHGVPVALRVFYGERGWRGLFIGPPSVQERLREVERDTSAEVVWAARQILLEMGYTLHRLGTCPEVDVQRGNREWYLFEVLPPALLQDAVPAPDKAPGPMTDARMAHLEAELDQLDSISSPTYNELVGAVLVGTELLNELRATRALLATAQVGLAQARTSLPTREIDGALALLEQRIAQHLGGGHA